MKKLLKNKSGFSSLEIILVVVIVGIIGAVGWYVIKAKNAVNSTKITSFSLDSAAKLSEEIEGAEAAETTVVVPKGETQKDLEEITASDDFIKYTSGELKFSFKYPKSWDVGKKNWDANSVTLTSPSKGILLSYADNAQSWPSNCSGKTKRIMIHAVQDVYFDGARRQLYLVDFSIEIEDGLEKGKVFKYVALTDWESQKPVVGESDKCVPFSASFQNKSYMTSWFKITDISEDYKNLSADEFFELPEVEVVRQIILSGKYE